MNYFEFNNLVKICSGNNALANIKHELDYFGATNPLILSDEGLKAVGTLKTVTKILSKQNLNTKNIFTNIPTDSGTDTINNIAKFYLNNNCDSIIALGGGSVIDTAKGVRLMLSQNVDNILSLSGNEIISRGKHIPFIVVPTTCGTGSECTYVAVIKDSKSHIKLEFISQAMLPDVAVLDSTVIETLPKKLIATTSIDALTHAIEAYSCAQKNIISSSFASASISLIVKNLLLSLNNPAKAEYKLNLLNASTLAGLAFSNSMVGIVHAIGHALGSVGVPHGTAMAVLLSKCLKFNLDVCESDYAELLNHFMGAEYFANIACENRAKSFVENVNTFVNNVSSVAGFSLHLADYGVTENQLESIAAIALNDGAAIINPKLFNKNDVINILKQCM